jgi:hypothetical protein
MAMPPRCIPGMGAIPLGDAFRVRPGVNDTLRDQRTSRTAVDGVCLTRIHAAGRRRC